MAKKPRRRPKHTNLVLPGEETGAPTPRGKNQKDRLGRTILQDAEVAKKKSAEATFKDPQEILDNPGLKQKVIYTAAKKKEAAPATPKSPPQKNANIPALPDNVIPMPSVNPRLVALRKKRKRKRIRNLVILLLIPLLLLFFFSGYHRVVTMKTRDMFEAARIAFTPGDGYPADFQLSGYIKAEPMANNGFAAVGKKDMLIYSSTGKKLQQVQHNYANPGLTTSKTRACIYARGGKEYIVESRTEMLVRRNTENDIQFAKLSPNGSLALVTAARHKATLEVYSPLYPEGEPTLKWTLDGEKPLLAAFHSNNRTLALGSVTASGGSLGSTIHLLNTGKSEPIATITTADALPLQMHFISSNRLLVIYDTFAAVYSTGGEQLSTVDYGGKTLLSADVNRQTTALALGSVAGETADLLVLDGELQTLFTRPIQNAANLQLLVERYAVFALGGNTVTAFAHNGDKKGDITYASNAYGLVGTKQPLALLPGSAETLQAFASPAGRLTNGASSGA